MIKFLEYKNINEQINLLESSITLNIFSSLINILQGVIVQGSELKFSIQKPSKQSSEYVIKDQNGWGIYKGQTKINSGSFAEFVKSELGIIILDSTFKNFLINFSNIDLVEQSVANLPLEADTNIPAQIDSIEKEIANLTESLKSELNDEQKGKFNRLAEVSERINSIQLDIDFYQNEKKLKEDLNNKIKKAKAEKENVGQMLQSVEMLIKSKQDLEEKLNAFSNYKDSYDKIKELKGQKVSYINSKLTTKQSVNLLNSEKDQVKSGSFFKNFNVTLTLALVNTIITLLAFLFVNNWVVLLVGVVFTIVLIIIYFVSRFFKDSLEDSMENKEEGFYIAKSVDGASLFDSEDPNTQLFINAAWASALEEELILVEENIKRNLNGKSYEELKASQKMVEQSIEVENKKLEELSKKSITSDEYYKKRREVDILKIEKENIEFGLKLNPEKDSKIKELVIKKEDLKLILENLKDFKHLLPIFLQNIEDDNLVRDIKSRILNQVILVRAN